VEGCCDHGNEPSGSVECWEVVEWLHRSRLLKEEGLGSMEFVFTRLSHFLQDANVKGADVSKPFGNACCYACSVYSCSLAVLPSDTNAFCSFRRVAWTVKKIAATGTLFQ
jgi:hypothetical protein